MLAFACTHARAGDEFDLHAHLHAHNEQAASSPLDVAYFALLCACVCVGALPMLLELAREWLAARAPRLEMRLLMLIAIGGAVALGEWIEAALLVAFYATAKCVERYVRHSPPRDAHLGQ